MLVVGAVWTSPGSVANADEAKYYVDTFKAAPGYAQPGSGVQTGVLNVGTNYVFCKAWGPEVRNGTSYNHWWLLTDLDSGASWENQWVSAYYLSRWGNDEARDNNGTTIADCGSTGPQPGGGGIGGDASAAATRAAGIAMRELQKEQYEGNDHATLACNFYTGSVRGADVRCRALGHSSWGWGDWCADFVKYTWREAGGIGRLGLIDSYAQSFKKYGIKNGTWHPVGSGYTPRPGDAAVYKDDNGNGLADHVGIVYQVDFKVYVVGGNGPDNNITYRGYDSSGVALHLQGFTSPVAG